MMEDSFCLLTNVYYPNTNLSIFIYPHDMDEDKTVVVGWEVWQQPADSTEGEDLAIFKEMKTNISEGMAAFKKNNILSPGKKLRVFSIPNDCHCCS
jgi:hypothetical protein